MNAEPFLQTHRLSKAFGGVQALLDVDFDLLHGEIHAVVGENGAGKSTLMKLLAGLEKPDAGWIELEGERLHFTTPVAALRRGIHLVHQELMPFRELTVAENLFAGQEPSCGLPGWLDGRRMRQETRRVLARLGMDLDPDRRMGNLTVAQMQTVEIARGLVHTARVLILDEPTSSLSRLEIDRLFGVLVELRSQGVAMVYITHKLDELSGLADRITVLRDGRKVLTRPAPGLKADDLIRHMVGREIVLQHQRPDARSGGLSVLEVRRLTCPGRFTEISFRLGRGEVLGMAGLIGAGRTDVANALVGLLPAARGDMRLLGRSFHPRHPAQALAAGVAMVTEDRQDSGVVRSLSVKENLTLSALESVCRLGWIRARREREAAASWMNTLDIRPAGLSRPIGALSGGNQQKVLLARSLMAQPKVLILDEPTRGIDVGAKAEIYQWVRRLSEQGVAILLLSSEMTELLLLAHRICVLCAGRMTGELKHQEATEERILSLAMPHGH